jgi:hypothetical protein
VHRRRAPQAKSDRPIRRTLPFQLLPPCRLTNSSFRMPCQQQICTVSKLGERESKTPQPDQRQ